MSMWLDARKRGEGWAAMDRGDVDGVRSWLNRMEGEERRKKLDEKDEDGRTMLHWAASRGDRRLVEVLLAFDASVDGSDEGGTTPLHSACGCGSEEIAKLLIEAEAKRHGDSAVRKLVRARTTSGITALHYAAGRGSQLLIDLLYQSGANIDAKDKYGNTPLARAVGKNFVDAARFLLEIGADPEIQNAAGDNVLHVACENGHEGMVKLLLNRTGLDLLEVKNNDEKTPLDVVDRAFKSQLIALVSGGG